MHGVGEFQSVHAAGHLYVGKQQRDVRARFEDGKRFVGVDGFNRRKSGILDNVDRTHAQHHSSSTTRTFFEDPPEGSDGIGGLTFVNKQNCYAAYTFAGRRAASFAARWAPRRSN